MSRPINTVLWQQLTQDVTAAMGAWRLAHPTATLREIELELVADRLKAICVFSFFTIFFWFAFEQSGGSMTIFAADYTDRCVRSQGAIDDQQAGGIWDIARVHVGPAQNQRAAARLGKRCRVAQHA